MIDKKEFRSAMVLKGYSYRTFGRSPWCNKRHDKQ